MKATITASDVLEAIQQSIRTENGRAEVAAFDHRAISELREALPAMRTSDLIVAINDPADFLEELARAAGLDGEDERDDETLARLAAAGVVLLASELDARIPPRRATDPDKVPGQ